MKTRTMTTTSAGGMAGVGPELVVSLARQIPTLETDALVRLITTSLPHRDPMA